MTENIRLWGWGKLSSNFNTNEPMQLSTLQIPSGIYLSKTHNLL